MMTGFVQGWMRSEQARHQALLHQLKRELAAARSIAPVESVGPAEPAEQPSPDSPAPSAPVLRSTTPRPVKQRTEGNRDLLRGVAIR